MAIYRVQGPDGKIYRFEGPDGATPDEVERAAAAQFGSQSQNQEEEPTKRPGFVGSFMETASTFGLTDEAAKFAADPSDANRKAFLDAAKSKYDAVGGFGKGENWEYVKELLGSSLGAIVAPTVAAAGVGAVSGGTGAIPAFATVDAAQYGITNLERQAREQQAAIDAGVAPNKTSLGKAGVAAVGQAGLDVIGGKVYGELFRRVPFLKDLAIGGGKEATNVFEDAVKKGAFKFTVDGIAKGVGNGVAFEVPQEVAQQALERWQAGLPLSDEDAKSEYIQAATGAAVLGGALGAAQGAVTTYPAAFKARRASRADDDEISALRERASEVNGRSQAEPTNTNVAPGVDTAQLDTTGRGESVPSVGEQGLGQGVTPDTVPVQPSGMGDAGVSSGVIETGTEQPPAELVPETAAPAEPQKAVSSQQEVETPTPQSAPLKYATDVMPDLTLSPTSDEVAAASAVPATTTKSSKLPAWAKTHPLKDVFYRLETARDNGKIKVKDVNEFLKQFKAATVEDKTAAWATLNKLTGKPDSPVLYADSTDLSEVSKQLRETEGHESAVANARRNIKSAKAAIYKIDTGIYKADALARSAQAARLEQYANDLRTLEELGYQEKQAKSPVTPQQTVSGLSVDIHSTLQEKGNDAALTEAKQKMNDAWVAARYAKRSLDAANNSEVPRKGAKPAAEYAANLKQAEESHAAYKNDVARLNEMRKAPQELPPVTATGLSADIDHILRLQGADIAARIAAKKADQARIEFRNAQRALETGKAVNNVPGLREKYVAKRDKAAKRYERYKGDAEIIRNRNKPVHYADSTTEFKGSMNAAELDKFIAAQITKGWSGAPNIYVVGSVNDLTPALRKRLEADKATKKPAFTTSTGSIYFIASNIKAGDYEFVKAKVFHEIMHAGLQKRFGNELTSLLDKIYNDSPQVQELVTNWINDHPESYQTAQGEIPPHIRATNEVFAIASENGVLTHAPAWEKIKAFIRRWVRKLFHPGMQFTDADIRAVLRLAQESIFKGSPISQSEGRKILRKEADGVSHAYYAPPKKETKKQREERERHEAERAAQVAEAEEKIKRSNPDSTFDYMGKLYKATRGDKPAIEDLKAAYPAMKVKAMRLAMQALSTDDMLRWAGDKIPKLEETNKAVQEMSAQRFRLQHEPKHIIDRWVQFQRASKEGGVVLSNAMHTSTLVGVNPGLFKDAAAAKAGDKFANNIRAEIKAAKNAHVAGQFKQPLRKRLNDIDIAYKAWEELGKYGPKHADGSSEGQKIFLEVLDHYKKQFAMYKQALIDQFKIASADAAADTATEEKVKKSINDMFKDVEAMDVYFPLVRYGKYWFEVGKGDKREFYMYEDAAQRNVALRQRVEELRAKGETRDLKKLVEDGEIDLGDSNKDAMAKFAVGTKALNDLYKSIDKSTSVSKEALKEQVFQMYMQLLPDMSMRKRLKKRKSITGFSGDTLRNFVTSTNMAANQISRLTHSTEIAMSILDARASLENNPDKTKLAVFVDEMEKRAGAMLEPSYTPPGEVSWDKVAAVSNQAVFYYMLTAPKSALVQMTQLHIVGIPVLASKYGLGSVTSMAAKYAKVWNTLGAKEAGIDKTGKEVYKWAAPSVRLSKYLENARNKEDLKWGWEYASNADKFMSTFTADVVSRGKKPTHSFESPVAYATRAALNFMGGAFHNLERMSREVMYMSAFELEYNKQRAAGKTGTEAREAAAPIAAKLLEEAMFNYSTFNKPRTMANPLGKVALQFMAYPTFMTSYLVRNFYNFIKNESPEIRKEAASKFFGTIGMTALYAGVTGLPMYSVIMGLADAMRDMFRDPEDEDSDDNPLTAHNLDVWFKQYFIPDTFGAGVVSQAITHGPISALTGVDLSSSTSLNSLWFRNEAPSDTYKDAFQQIMFNTTFGATGSMGLQIAAAFDDFNNGDFRRGLEKILPAFLRGPAKAARFADEGARTKQGDVIAEQEYYTFGKLLAASLNFSDLSIAEIQKNAYALKQESAKIVRERNKLLDKVEKAYSTMEDDPSEGNMARVDRVLEDVVEFNSKYPVLPITGETLSASLMTRASQQAMSQRGLRVQKQFYPYAEDILMKSIQNEEQ